MRTRHLLLAVLIAATAGAMSPRLALADAQTYASGKRQIRVAIVTSSALNVAVPSGVSPENPDPHVFFVAENRSDLKPLGLEFVNPLAPPVLTSSTYQRWLNRVRNGATDPAFVNRSVQNQIFQIGAKVTKNMGPYWEINLDTVSADDLKQFDLLYIHSHRVRATFPAEQREKLRKFIDAGGTLWVENCGFFSFDNTSPFLFDVNMHSGANNTAGAVIAEPNHPLMSYPFILSPNEIQRLGDKFVNDYYLFVADPTNVNDTGPGPNALNPPGAGALSPIVWNTRGLAPANVITPNPGWRPYVLTGSVGAGRIVYTSGDSGCAINDYVGGANAGYGGNSGAISGEGLSGAHPTDLKFLYNLAIWSGSHSTSLTDTRRTGATQDKIGATLVDKWAEVHTGNGRVGGATTFKHAVFAVDGDMVLHCYDASPGQDLDGDGNPDDGVIDFIAGKSVDEIWSFDLRTVPGANAITGCSTPTCYEFYDPNYSASPAPAGKVNFNNRDQVVVVLSNGTVVALRAFPRDNQPGFPYSSTTVYEWLVSGIGTDFPIPGASTLQIPAAAWSEGVVFASIYTANGGRVAAIDPRTGFSAFHLSQIIGVGQGLIPDVPGVPATVGTPTVGYVRDVGTGSNDKMLYVHTQALSSGGSQTLPETIRAYPFSTRGEPLARQGTSANYNSRSSGTTPSVPWYVYDPAAPGDSNPLLRQRVFCTYKDPTSGAIATMELALDQTGVAANSYKLLMNPGQPVQVTVSAALQFPNGGPAVPGNDDNLTVYADYTLDWSTTGTIKVNARSVLTAPDITGGGNKIGGAPALSGQDIAYYTVDTSGTAGTNSGRGVVFAAAEQGILTGTNRTTMKWAWAAHNGFTATLDDGSTRAIPPRLRVVNNGTEAVLAGSGAKAGDYLLDVQFVGSPAVHDGIVYATAIGRVASSATPNVSLVCAFRANPELKLNLGPGIDRNTPILIRQVNPVTAQGANAPPIPMNPGQYTVDFDSGIVRIISMAPQGVPAMFFSTSVPFLVKVGNAPERLIYGTQLDTWTVPNLPNPPTPVRDLRMVGAEGVDNLLWYAIVPADYNPAGSHPLKQMGFVTTPPSIQGDILWLGFSGGKILSMDADPASSDPAAAAAGAEVKMMDDAGVAMVHLRSTADIAGGAPPIGAPGGTGDVLVVNTPRGTHAFEDTHTIIADAKRLIEVNGAGDAIWTSDGTRTYGLAGGDLPQYIVDPGTGNVIPVNPAQATGVAVVQKVPWARPTVARRIGVTDLLVVDTGNNRVVQVDRGGNTIWEVSRLFDDMRTLTRPGEPLTLNEPTDCQYWTEFVPNFNAWFAANGMTYTLGNQPGYVVHYLIADTGNFRVIELVDGFDAAGRPVTPLLNGNPAGFQMTRQLFFTSSTFTLQGKRYRYRALQRVVMRNSDLPASWQDPNKAVGALIRLTLGVIQNYRLVGDASKVQNAVNAFGDTVESEGGSLVVLGEDGKPLSVVSNLRIPNGAGGFVPQPITNPTWFSKFDDGIAGGLPVFKFLLADANGCYQLVPDADPNYMNVEWMISADDYYRMTGKKLVASSIRRLSTGASAPNTGLRRFLITNRFSGPDNPTVFGITYNLTANPLNGNISGVSQFNGEVFELDPGTFSFSSPLHGYVPDYARNGNFLLVNPVRPSIVWRTPTERVPAAQTEIGTLERSIGSKNRATSTSLLEQPAFADRKF